MEKFYHFCIKISRNSEYLEFLGFPIPYFLGQEVVISKRAVSG